MRDDAVRGISVEIIAFLKIHTVGYKDKSAVFHASDTGRHRREYTCERRIRIVSETLTEILYAVYADIHISFGSFSIQIVVRHIVQIVLDTILLRLYLDELVARDGSKISYVFCGYLIGSKPTVCFFRDDLTAGPDHVAFRNCKLDLIVGHIGIETLTAEEIRFMRPVAVHIEPAEDRIEISQRINAFVVSEPVSDRRKRGYKVHIKRYLFSGRERLIQRDDNGRHVITVTLTFDIGA